MTEKPLFHRLADLTGRIALVTGAAGHIGRQVCEAFAELGSAIAAVDRTDDVATFAAALASKHGVRAAGIVADLAAADAVPHIIGEVDREFAALDILVNCAAFVGTSGLTGWATDFERQSVETFDAALAVNLTAPFALTQAATPLLRRSSHASVINVGSIYGLVGPDLSLYEGTSMGNPGAYAASKGGLLQMTRWLATVLAPRIRVNALTPGGIERGQPEVFQQRYRERTPLGRMGTEQDLVGAAVYLASDLSSYVTGQNIVVDGGWTAW